MDICEYKARLQNETRHPWEIARARAIADLVGDYFCQENRSVRLLDFGCGDGFIAQTLVGKYALCHLVGVDKKIHELNFCKGRRQESDRIRYLENLQELEGNNYSFDGALLLDVLEHIDDDELFLREFFNLGLFVEHAKFVITCSAFGKLFSQHDSLLGHFRRYSLPELRGKIESAGGIPIESGYIFLIPLVLRVVEVLLEKAGTLRRRERTHISNWNGGPLATKVISSMLYFDALFCRLLRKLPLAGLTCYVICRRQVS